MSNSLWFPLHGNRILYCSWLTDMHLYMITLILPFSAYICLCWMMWIYCVFSNNYLISILRSKAHLTSEVYRDLQPPLICFPTLTCNKKTELYGLITFMLSCHSAAKSIMLFLDPSQFHTGKKSNANRYKVIFLDKQSIRCGQVHDSHVKDCSVYEFY